SIYLFFFQAEDGIRDFHVTGVQTCALPIYEAGGSGDIKSILAITARTHDVERIIVGEVRLYPHLEERIAEAEDLIYRDAAHQERSEERRVGKECRTRGSTKL